MIFWTVQINAIKDFSTKLTGNSADNVKSFMDTLRASVSACKYDKVQNCCINTKNPECEGVRDFLLFRF